MGVTENIIIKNSYRDSVFLMETASKAETIDGINNISLMMGTPANIEILKNSGLLTDAGKEAGPGDLLIAVKADTAASVNLARKLIEESFEGRSETSPDGEETPLTIKEALLEMPDADFALISVPGEYAAREAKKALESGLNCMIFSDNVSIEEEVSLKKRASELGLLLMGPDCGTAIINSVPLGFANQVPPGDIGLAAASGTGLQEVTSLIAESGRGITHALGTGGRDLSLEVGGLSMISALERLSGDPATRVIVVISKPPHPGVAGKIIQKASETGKPAVICFLEKPGEKNSGNLYFTSTLEETAKAACHLSAGRNPSGYNPVTREVREAALKASSTGNPKNIRGFFCGGSLKDEAAAVINMLGVTPEGEGVKLTDFGADEFTRGKPHPMIDPAQRNTALLKEAGAETISLILFDIVLGHGAHPDPAGAMEETLGKIPAGRVLAASVCGTRGDPQGLDRQTETLKKHGVFLFSSSAKAAAFAAETVKGAR